MRPVLFLFFVALFLRAGAQPKFPDSFAGHWQGEVSWYRPGTAEPRKFKMQLLIEPVDTANYYTWKTLYGDKGEDVRPYELKPVDTEKGHWVVDEKNGILLDQYFLGGKIHSVFSVGGSTIVNSYWLEGENLHVEFVSYPAKAVRTSGAGTEESPTVESYGVRSYQKGILKRVKPR